jgi:SNF2 family DNA or RNA helicase
MGLRQDPSNHGTDGLAVPGEKGTLPFIVVCPTTVISHWSRKIQEHASTLLPIVYHGTDRELEKIETSGTVLITSYGILLRDINQLPRCVSVWLYSTRPNTSKTRIPNHIRLPVP